MLKLKRIKKKKILEGIQKRKSGLKHGGEVSIKEGGTNAAKGPPGNAEHIHECAEEDSAVNEDFGPPGFEDEQQTNYSQDTTDNLHIHGTQTIRRTRGPTRLPNIWNRLPGQEIPDQFNMYNQCIDDGKLSKFCGTIARDSKITPLGYDDWRKVPESDKEQIWRIVKIVEASNLKEKEPEHGRELNQKNQSVKP